VKPVLLRTDPAARTLPWLALAGVAAGAMTVGVGRMGAVDEDLREQFTSILFRAPLMEVLVAAWMVALWYGARERVDEVRLAMPVSARTWVGVHAVVLLLLGWLPLALVPLTAALGTGSIDVLAPLLAPVCAAALAWAAWVASCIAWQPARLRLESTPLLVAVTVACAVLAWIGLYSPWIGAVLSLTVLVPSAAFAWRGAPRRVELAGAGAVSKAARAALSDQPRTASRSSGFPAIALATAGLPSAVPQPSERRRSVERWDAASAALFRSPERTLRAWIARLTWQRGRNAFALTLLPVFAVVLFDPWSSGPFRGLAGALYLAWLLWIVLTSSLRALRNVGHLPIPRQRLAIHVLAPTLLSLLAGTGAAILIDAAVGGIGTRERVDLTRRDLEAKTTKGFTSPQRVQVPGSLTRLVLGSQSITVTAPFGESATLQAEPVLAGLPLAVLNPYDIAADSSIDFVAWQLSRALHDAYGLEIASEALRERYLSELNGRVIGPFLGQEVLEHHPEAHAPQRGARRGWFLAMIVIAWALAAWAATVRNVPPLERDARSRRRLAALVVPLLGLALFAVAMFLPLQWSRRLPPLEDVLAATALDAVGGRPWVLPLVALAFAALAYRIAARRFARLEVPPPLRNTWYRRA
jgi:hypothetical protein